MTPLFRSTFKVCLALALICSFGTDCMASNPLFISPFGNSSYYKKRTSEKDFSFSPEYDFSLHHIRLGADELLRISTWKNKSSLERLVTTKNKHQKLLDFFYTEITSSFNLSKTPKKQYHPETYERLILFSHLTKEFGNTDLSHKLFEYYQAMWINR